MSKPHRATLDQWADIEQWGGTLTTCLLELRSRLEALEAGATCPHIVSSDEGTSYCALAEATARIGQPDVPANMSDEANSKPSSNDHQIRGSLMERVADAIREADEECMADSWAPEASAAIRVVAEWFSENAGGAHAAWMLEQEAER